VLEEMRDNPDRGLDPLLVKALINVTGIYPVGTLTILDTHELAGGHGAEPDPSQLHLPMVKVIYNASGASRWPTRSRWTWPRSPPAGHPDRRIIKTTRADATASTWAAYFL
jgi:hypothetical protein